MGKIRVVFEPVIGFISASLLLRNGFCTAVFAVDIFLFVFGSALTANPFIQKESILSRLNQRRDYTRQIFYNHNAEHHGDKVDAALFAKIEIYIVAFRLYLLY